MKVFIVDSKNNKIPIEINLNETVKDLKEKIKVKMGINDNIVIHINGQILDCDSNKLDDYDIDENDTITVVMQFRAGRFLNIINCKY